MANRRILSLAVVVCLFAITSYAFAVDYYTYTKADIGSGPNKDVSISGPASAPNWEIVGQAQCPGLPFSQLNSGVYTSAGDNTASIVTNYQNAVTGEPTMKVQAFSYSSDIPTWLAAADKTLLYSETKVFNPQMTPYTDQGLKANAIQKGMAASVIAINSNGAEQIVKHMTNEDSITDSLGMNNWGAYGSAPQSLSDFAITDTAVDSTKTQYLTSGKTASVIFTGDLSQVDMGLVAWGALGTARGSGAGGKANTGDILMRLDDGEGTITYKYYAKAPQIAALLLGYDMTGKKWNNITGQIVNATTGANITGDGADTMRNFIRYVMAIDGLVVYDAADDGGVYNASTDAILFSLVDDSSYNKGRMWTDTGDQSVMVSTPFAGQYFRGDVVFKYQGNTITTYFDPKNGIFFGNHITTGNKDYFMTIWAGQKGTYDLQGLEIGYQLDGNPAPPNVVIPEPSTVILIVGSALAFGAGIIRKRIR